MIRRRTRTAKQRDALAYKQSAPVGTGLSRDERKTMLDAEEARVIREVRAYIWLTRFNCQLCHGARARDCMGLPDEMHEDPPRSATRGLPPTERFNLLVCGRLCAACHRDVTRNRLRVVFHRPDLGFLGPVTSEPVS
jgi:hypothetical protein